MINDHKIVLAQEMASTMVQLNRLAFQHESFHELKRSEFIFMASLSIMDGPASDGVKASELSKFLQVTGAAVTHNLNALEKAGYVERVSDPADRRIVLVKLTNDGQQIMELANETFLDSLKGLITFLGEKDSMELLRLLALTMNYLKKEKEGI
jgi:DNA-binding MarR family transcriptional regulator